MTEMHPAKIPTSSPSNTSETENPWGNYDIMGKDFKKEVEKCRQLRMTGQII